MIRLFAYLLFTLLLSFSLSSYGQKRTIDSFQPRALKEGAITPIWINVNQHSVKASASPTYFKDTLIRNSKYDAIRIGEYLWMNKNLSDRIPFMWACPYSLSGTDYVGWGCTKDFDLTQSYLNKDMDRLFIDKSQFQIDMAHFHEYYGRYYTRTDIEYFKKRATVFETYNERNLVVYEGADKIQTDWKVPMNRDFRQLFAMASIPNNGTLGQIAVRVALSYKRGENPLAYDIYDPKGGMNYRTSWFEMSTNELGFNMMPGGSRVNGAGFISNGLGPNNGAWWLEKGEIYHLFHTAKYLTADSQVGIHDNLSTGQGPSWHWYNVRFCRELTDEELGYKLYINKEQYEEGYEYTILDLDPKSVDIIKLDLNQPPPKGYFELQKGYLRGFYVKHILNSKRPASVKQIVEYLKQVDDDLFFDEDGNKVSYIKEELPFATRPLLEVYPNPMENVLHIDLMDMEDEIKSIQVNNFYGLQMLQMQKLERYNDIDVSRLSVGLYILQVETAKGVGRYKLMKQ